MNLSWSVLALALIGAQDQQPSQPKTPSSPIAIEVGSESCRKAATAITVEPDVPTATKTARKVGALAKLVDFCVERCVDLVVDEAKAALAEKLTEVPTPAVKPATCPKEAAYGVPPAGKLSSTLAMQLPKVVKPRTINDAEAAEAWPMALRDAMRIGLDNSEIVRVIAFGAQGIPVGGIEPPRGNFQPIPGDANSNRIVIQRLNADAAVWRFKAEVMAHVRSVEQQYWNLAQAHVQLWAADRAVALAQEIRDREQAELKVGRGTVADVAEASQRLEQFKLDLVTRTSDIITAERQLRNLLGLPPADNRRIIPVTPPTEQLINYDWDVCLSEMMEEQPDIAQQKAVVRVAELRLLLARNQLVPLLDLNALDQLNGLGQQLDSALAVMTAATLKALEPVKSDGDKAADPNANPGSANNFLTCQPGFVFQMPMGRAPLANSRQAQYGLLRSRAYLKQIEHQTTHSLARFFLEIDANYKQYRTAVRLRTAAAQRLDAQRAYYDEGRITIDRFLDAVSQYATAVATEAQYRSTYNISLAALAEAKGTLLADRDIVIAEGPRPRKAYVQVATSQKPVPAPAAMPFPGGKIKLGRPLKWKGTQDLMTVAAVFAADLPGALEVPRAVTFATPRYSRNGPLGQPIPDFPGIVAFSMPPMVFVNDAPGFDTKTEFTASCCEARPEATSTVTNAKVDPACTLTKADAPAKAKPKTWTFSISIGGANPLQIKGTITEGEAEPPAAVGH